MRQMFLGLALACLGLLSACSPQREAPTASALRPNVVILLLDTVRADRLGCYGSPRALTPNLDALAAQSQLFEDCSSVSCWTLPSHASLFTGVQPVAHRATQETLHLDDAFPTLAELLGAAGYDSYGASANAVVGPANGLDRGFAHFEELYRPEVEASHREPGRHPHAVALEKWLQTRDGKLPFFAFLNFIEAHAPYRPPQPYFQKALPPGLGAEQALQLGRTRNRDHYLREGGLDASTLAALSALYDGEIAYLDAAVAQVYELLRRRGDLENTLLIVTADHGEAFGEHGHLAHSFSLHREVLQLPLLLRWPGAAGGGERVSAPVSLLDLFPTILEATNTPLPERVDGRSLSASPDPTRPLFAEYYYPSQVLSTYTDDELAAHAARFAPLMQRLRAVRLGTRKLILDSDGGEKSYRLDEDPMELSTSDADPQLRDLLLEYEARFAGPVPVGPVPPRGWRGPGFEDNSLDESLLEQLRALGYVD